MFSDRDIKKAIENKSLIVEPFRPESIRPAGITLHLGEKILKPSPGVTVDIKNKILPDYSDTVITEDSPYKLEPSEFILGHTLEKVTVGNDLGFLIEGRSTLARLGLTVVQTAMLVYPGHKERAVTLELVNHSSNPILLYPGMKIARVVLIRLDSPCENPYDQTGKYAEQESVGAPVFKDEFTKIG